MNVVKMGKYHFDMGINCQDFAVELPGFKMITDGCSACANSEVGAKLFCHLFPKTGFDITKTFNILRVLYDTDQELKDNLLFTILIVNEYEDCFKVLMCGDGYIIKQRLDDTFEFEKFDYDSAPPYYAYNLLYNRDCLKKYKEGVGFQQFTFLKSEYKNIGVASDGLDYILDSCYKDEFETILQKNKAFPLKLFINRGIKYFKDDMSIVL